MKMNKKILAAACGLLVSGVVCADDMKFYVGGDLGYNKYKYGSNIKQDNDFLKNIGASVTEKSKTPSFGVLAGLRYCENFGAELGYTFYKKVKYNISFAGIDVLNDSSFKVNNMHVDLLGYMPIGNDFELIGALGVGRTRTKADVSTNALGDAALAMAGEDPIRPSKINKVGLRAGLGAQYNIDEHFAARAMVRFQKVGKKSDMEVIKSMTSFNLGLTYTI